MILEGVLYEVVSREEGSAVIRLLPDSPVYAAHFPGYPSGAKDIKFVEPVLPSSAGTLLRFTWTFPEADKADVNVYLEGDTLCSKMSLWLR
jgi:hypothetical protein